MPSRQTRWTDVCGLGPNVFSLVFPANPGSTAYEKHPKKSHWIPAFAGMAILPGVPLCYGEPPNIYR